MWCMLFFLFPETMSLPALLEKDSMTEATLTQSRANHKLISFLPETDLSRLAAEGYALAQAEPCILEMIDQDRDAFALNKKKERLEDKVWFMSQGRSLPGFDIDSDEEWADRLELFSGRTRMPAELVLIFILIRGYLGGFKDKKTAMILAESKTLEIILSNLDLRLPGASTILDNINPIRLETLEFIMDAQIRYARTANLDTFRKLTVDSTSVEANSIWPTDSGTIVGLATRAENLLRGLSKFGISLNLPVIAKQHLADMDILHKQIQMSSGKKDSATKRKRYYKKLCKLAKKIRRILLATLERGNIKASGLELMPSLRARLMMCLDWIRVDLSNLGLSIENAESRVLRNEKVPAKQKILSFSDQDAALIKKGDRDPLLGYKPQIARSGNGFVTALIVPEGNAADSDQLRSIVDKSLKRTGIVPSVLSLDDGYTNSKDRDYYLDLGIAVVSFSGSKGKRLIPEDEYNSRPYKKARNDRSAVESLIFTLKHNNDFDQVMRRGIENVRAELLEKSIVHNFFRMIRLRQVHDELNAAA